jgi:hypothetical protein
MPKLVTGHSGTGRAADVTEASSQITMKRVEEPPGLPVD